MRDGAQAGKLFVNNWEFIVTHSAWSGSKEGSLFGSNMFPADFPPPIYKAVSQKRSRVIKCF